MKLKIVESRWVRIYVFVLVWCGFSVSMHGCTEKTTTNRRTSFSRDQLENTESIKNRRSPGDLAADASIDITPIKSGTTEISKGKSLYQGLCVQCHPALGQGEIKKFQEPCKTCEDFNGFVTKVMATMPLGKVGVCDRDCSRAIGLYLFSPL